MKTQLLLKFCLLFALILNSNWSASAQSNKIAHSDSILTVKNFPLLSLINHNINLKTVLQNDKVIKNISLSQKQRALQSIQNISSIVSNYSDSLKWKENEITSAGTEMIKIYQLNKSFRNIISQLRKQGSYALYESFPDTTYLRSAWTEAATGINQIFDTYITGKKQHYPNIDSISFRQDDPDFKQQIQNSISSSLVDKHKTIFFEVPLSIALNVLKINGRDEVARFEPLNQGLNHFPYLKIKKTDFSKYAYSVILIPGAGPDKPGIALNPKGAKRCDEGVIRFRKGLAAFIVVSGGNVHPYKTTYNEAVEMKKYIVEKLGVPADVVFIEPHARHTTTNLRNTSRMIYRFGLPTDKPVLIVTDSSQSSYIVQGMDKIAQRDLRNIPFKNIKRLTDQETEFYPIWNCLQVDPFDPLDP